MPKKLVFILHSNLVIIFFSIFFLIPTSAQAVEVPLRCEEKPLMERNILSSYPRSSYIDCKQDSVLCENASQPQATAVALLADKPTSKPTIKPVSTASASAKPQPTVTPTPNPTAVPTNALPTGSLSADKLFEMINAHRLGKGLPAYEKESRLCELAQSRGPELHNEIYGSGYIHQGFRERNLPFWITENMISKETEEAAFAWWLNSSVHHAGIDSSKQFACGACVANSCVMLFTSWEPK